MNNKELMHWVAFSAIKGIGPKRISKLLNYFGSLNTAWEASSQELKLAGIDQKTIESIQLEKKTLNPEKLLEDIYKKNIGIITKVEDEYPSLLKEIPDAPSLLYYYGTLSSPSDQYAVAIVGSRKVSKYGEQVTEDITKELTQNNIPVVSGLALGVDTIAHKTCVKNQARTIAVLGNGLDMIYPASNRSLALEIVDNGGVIFSEFSLKTPSYKSNFPYRNRIIAGLSIGTCVVEATDKSGSLITANMAVEYNREIFAVPGSIYSNTSKGPHQLIKQGAQIVANGSDILSCLNISQTSEKIAIKEITSSDPDESEIISLLQATPRSIDDLAKHTTLDVSNINSILVSMELKGMVRNSHGTLYHLAR